MRSPDGADPWGLPRLARHERQQYGNGEAARGTTGGLCARSTRLLGESVQDVRREALRGARRFNRVESDEMVS